MICRFVLMFIFSCIGVSNANAGGADFNLSPLVSAIISDDYDAAKTILNSRKIESEIFNGSPVLLFAINPSCKPNFIKLLLQNGADPNAREVGTETTPILEALAQGNMECVGLLIEHGGNVSLIDANGSGAAYKAVASGNLTAVKLVASMGGDLDAPRTDGTTPLMYAARAGYIDIIKYLLKGGADECKKNKRGMTPKGFSELSKNSDLKALFLKVCETTLGSGLTFDIMQRTSAKNNGVRPYI